MLYQNMLTGYLFEVPEPQAYSGARMVYDGLGNPRGYITPFGGAAEMAPPRFVPVAYPSSSGLGQAMLQQPQMPMIPPALQPLLQSPLAQQALQALTQIPALQQGLQPVSQMPAAATAFAPAPDLSMQTPQIPMPGQLPILAPATGIPVPAAVGAGVAPMPVAPPPAGEPGALYCYSQPQPGIAVERFIPPPSPYHRRRVFRRRRF